MEPKVGREQPANEKAFVSTLLAGTSKSLIGALVALHLAKQAEDEIEASDGREGGEIFITMTRVFAGITIGLFLLVLLGGLTMWLFSAIGH